MWGEPAHDALCKIGESWLRQQGCRVVLRDPFRAVVDTGECPDVIGWRQGRSILIECKTSRSDFLADSAKPFRQHPERGMGDARLYLAPQGVIHVEDLPAGWGLLEAISGEVRIESAYPRQYEIGHRKGVCLDWLPFPFIGNKPCETSMLLSALARRQRATEANRGIENGGGDAPDR